MTNSRIVVPTNRVSREEATKSFCCTSNTTDPRPDRWLEFTLTYRQLEYVNGTGSDEKEILTELFNMFPDCKLFLKKFYGGKDAIFKADKISQLIKSWLDKRIIFDPHCFEVPLYGEFIDLELSKRMDIVINHTDRQVSHETFVHHLRQVRFCVCFVAEWDNDHAVRFLNTGSEKSGRREILLW